LVKIEISTDGGKLTELDPGAAYDYTDQVVTVFTSLTVVTKVL
jgi:hypothetical protein